MKKKIILALLCLTGAVMLSASSCPNAPINTDDSTPPTVNCRVKVGDKPYVDVPAGEDPIKVRFDKEVNLACTIEDPEGMKTITLEFPKKGADNCNPKVGSGSKSGQPLFGQPKENLSDSAKVVSGNQVATKLVMTAQMGPFACTYESGEDGLPLGSIFPVNAIGENQSSNDAVKTTTKKIFFVIVD